MAGDSYLLGSDVDSSGGVGYCVIRILDQRLCAVLHSYTGLLGTTVIGVAGSGEGYVGSGEGLGLDGEALGNGTVVVAFAGDSHLIGTSIDKAGGIGHGVVRILNQRLFVQQDCDRGRSSATTIDIAALIKSCLRNFLYVI